jgi:hypothetical protein
MFYIESLFVKVQEFIRSMPSDQELVARLEAEPKEYRSVAYEAAAAEMAIIDLQRGGLKKIIFEKAYMPLHVFHIGIGVGWAFAYTEQDPGPCLESLGLEIQGTIFDGFGYYYGLFRARRTIKAHEVPPVVTGDHLSRFDRGLGRRIWYNSRGNPEMVATVVQTFPVFRQPNLWRGVGVGVGYVGGCDMKKLTDLITQSSVFCDDLADGIALAFIARRLSNSVTPYLQLASEVVCKKNMEEMIQNEKVVIEKVRDYI